MSGTRIRTRKPQWARDRSSLAQSENQGNYAAPDENDSYGRRELLTIFRLDAELGIADLDAMLLLMRNRHNEGQHTENYEQNTHNGKSLHRNSFREKRTAALDNT